MRKGWILMLMFFDFSCIHVDDIKISSDYVEIIDIVSTNYLNLVQAETRIPLILYPASLAIKSKNFSSPQFGEQEKLHKLCMQQKINLIYICSKEEIWLEVSKDDNWINAKRTLVGKVLNLKPPKFEINYYKVKSLKAISNDWYKAEIKFSLVD